MDIEKDKQINELVIQNKEQSADVDEQLNMRIRLILKSFDPLNPGPGQELGKQQTHHK